MFDRHYHKKNVTEIQEVIKNVNITEHRAPTDESLRLLNEMQQKVISNILHSVEIKDNTLNGVVLYHRDDMISGKVRFGFDFKINGKSFRGDGSVEYHELDANYPFGSRQVKTKIFQILAEEIAAELVKNLTIKTGTGI